MGRTRRSSPILGAIGAGLVLVGSGLVVGAWQAPAGGARTVGRNEAINPGAADSTDETANNSPTLVRNPAAPANLVLANRIDGPRFSCALDTSLDAGATWRPVALPFPDGEDLPPRCFAPDVSFAADGRLYVSFATLIGSGNSPHAVWLVTSTDGGLTFDVPRRVLGALAFQVRLATDPSRSARLYLSWLQAGAVGFLSFAGTGNRLMTARSDDAGRSWSSPVPLSPTGRPRVVAATPAVLDGGRLVCAYLDLGDDRLDYEGGHRGEGGPPYPGVWELVVARSTDGGQTWQETVVEPHLVPIERFIVYLPAFPSVAVDRRHGRVYVAFHSAPFGDPDVFVWTSGDGGASFGPAVRVNDTTLRDGRSQYLPALAVAPDGRLDVMYYDRRADPADVRNQVSFQSSYDGGRTFGRHVELSDHSFDARIGRGSDLGLADLGSRLALVSSDTAAFGVWPDTRAGRVATADRAGLDKQDLARAVVTVEKGSPLRSPLRSAGPALLAAGVLVVVAWLASAVTADPDGAGTGLLA